jgi:gliding motility-associated lipoprotein GldD
MKGNTASPIQFYLTDSTKDFFRAALYFNNIPNQDSLAPVIDYLREDIMMMMETFRWK